MLSLKTPMSVFRVDETHGRAVRSGNRLIANSEDAGWRSLHAAIIEEGPFEMTEPPNIDTLAQMMAVHRARHHSSQSKPARVSATRTMSGAKMRRVIEYIAFLQPRTASIERLSRSL